VLAVFDGQIFGHIQGNIPHGLRKQAHDLPDEMDFVPQMGQGQSSLRQVFLVQHVQIGQEVRRMKMFTHYGTQLRRNVFGFLSDAAHTADQAVFTNPHPHTVYAFAHLRKRLVTQQELGEFLQTPAQLVQHTPSPLARPMGKPLNVAHKKPAAHTQNPPEVAFCANMEIIPPFSLITLRLILGILTLIIVVVLRGGPKTSRKEFWQIFGVGFIGYGISLGFQFVGTKLSTAANGALVTSATPAFVLLFAALLLGKRITLRRSLALIIASIGVLAVIDPRNIQIASSLFKGNLCPVAAGLTWALYSVMIRKVTRNVDVLTTSLIAFTGGLPISIPMGTWELTHQTIGKITSEIIFGMLFLGIISTALAMYLWNTAFTLLDAGIASLTFFAQPVVGTILGSLILGELITPLFLVGGLLIGLGLVIASIESKDR